MTLQDFEPQYSVCSTNIFNPEIKGDCVAYFFDLETAHDYVSYRQTLGDSMMIVERNTNKCLYSGCD